MPLTVPVQQDFRPPVFSSNGPIGGVLTIDQLVNIFRFLLRFQLFELFDTSPGSQLIKFCRGMASQSPREYISPGSQSPREYISPGSQSPRGKRSQGGESTLIS